jgi:uncharacterized protein (TIGR03083 family)
MSEELDLVKRRLEEEGVKTAAFFESLSMEDLGRQVYVTGSGWRVHDLLAHFVSAERAYVEYLRLLLQGGRGVTADFDIDEFNESEVPRLSLRPTEELLGAFRRARAESVATVAALQPADLDRRGRHPWFGETDLRSVLKLLYRHPMIHLRDARRALKTGRPVAPSDEDSAVEGSPS